MVYRRSIGVHRVVYRWVWVHERRSDRPRCMEVRERERERERDERDEKERTERDERDERKHALRHQTAR